MPVYKYFIAVIPGPDLSERITSLRKTFLPGVNNRDDHKKFPHITLQHTFSRSEIIEKDLGRCLNELARTVKPFPVKLSGVGHFDGRIIYVKVDESETLNGLYRGVKSILVNKFQFSTKEVSADFKPHVTLEKKIAGEDFNMHWKNIKDVEVNERFIADSFSLLRHNGVKWVVIENYLLT